MTIKSYLWGMRAGALLSLIAWIMVLFFIDLDKSGILGKALFFLSTFLFLSGIFILFFTWSRSKIGKGEIAFANISASFRQGILLSALAVILLFVQAMRLLVWWDAALIVAGVFLIELYFLTRNS